MADNSQYTARRAAFRKLHESGCFMLPNPYDIGTAIYLKHSGFKALASTSAGFAFSRGLPDHAVTRDMVLAHLRELVAATDLPVNADYEHGYADAPQQVAENVRLAVATGIAGVSIEDSTNDKSKPPLYRLNEAVERMRAARAAIDATGEDVMLIGRAECFLVGHEDALNESIRRLQAYAEAGADCLYAPGVRKREDIEALVKAVAPKPFNLLVGMASPLTLDDFAAMGVRRIRCACWRRVGRFCTRRPQSRRGYFRRFRAKWRQNGFAQSLCANRKRMTIVPDQSVGAPVDAKPAQRPQRTTLSGHFVRLSPLDAGRHLDDLFASMGGSEHASLWTYMFDGPFVTHAAFAEAVRKRQASEDPLFFAIEDAESGRAIGIASLMRIEPAHRVIEVGGIVFSPALQRKPGATEAMYLMARHVFEDLGYRRYEWKCDALNAPSRRAALRLGFTFEGIFRSHMIVKGRNRDTAWFSMLDTEWPARKAAFETWLAPDNFASSGTQRQSLSAMMSAGAR